MAGLTNKELNLYTVDAFASKPFSGNPAAVCPLSFNTELDDATLLNIAMEMSLSETAFIRPLSADDDHKTGRRFGLRWFTPKQEIKLCGHATLASAAVLFNEIGNQSDEITFETLSGDLIVKKDGEHVVMDLPLGVTEKKNPSDYEAVIKSFGKCPEVQDARWCPSLQYLLLRFKDGWTRSEFENWRPNIGQMESSLTGVIVVIATTRGGNEQGYVDAEGKPYDFVSRCFAPWTGVPEDAVTGSAQTVLTHYWSQELGKQEFYARQCSSRGGEISMKMQGERVSLRGKATLVVKGVLRM